MFIFGYPKFKFFPGNERQPSSADELVKAFENSANAPSLNTPLIDKKYDITGYA